MNVLLQYDHAGGRQMDGLTRRRQAERLMFIGLVKQALRLAGAHAATPEQPMPQKVDHAPVIVLPKNPVDLPDTHKPDPVPQPKPPAPPTNWWTLIVSIFRAIFNKGK
jgi:hypothetical protein